MTIDLEMAQALCGARIAMAIDEGTSQAMEQVSADFMEAVVPTGSMRKEEAQAWFAQEILRQARAKEAARKAQAASRAIDPLQVAAIVLVVALIGAGSVALLLRVVPAADRGNVWAWITNGGWIAVMGAYPLFKLLVPLVYAGLNHVREVQRDIKGWEQLGKTMRENEKWVWLCQRCEATYAYHGEPDATCGRCGNRLTKVMGMRL